MGTSIVDVNINRQGFEKRVVSQDLQLWLSNVNTLLWKYNHQLIMVHLRCYIIWTSWRISCSVLNPNIVSCHHQFVGTTTWRWVYSSCSSWTPGIIAISDSRTIYSLIKKLPVIHQVQEIQLTTSLDQEGIKRALQHVLERVPWISRVVWKVQTGRRTQN